jgi:hypothetical protein
VRTPVATVTTTIWDTSPEDPDNPFYTCYTGDMSLQGWVRVKEHTIEFQDISREEKIAAAVLALRQHQEKMVERHRKEFQALQDRIANLLAITNHAQQHAQQRAQPKQEDEDDLPF